MRHNNTKGDKRCRDESKDTKPYKRVKKMDVKRSNIQMFEIIDAEVIKEPVRNVVLTDEIIIGVVSNYILCYNIEDRQFIRKVEVCDEKNSITTGFVVSSDTVLFLTKHSTAYIVCLSEGEVIYSFKTEDATPNMCTDFYHDYLVMCMGHKIVLYKINVQSIIVREKGAVVGKLHSEVLNSKTVEEITCCDLYIDGLITGSTTGLLTFYDFSCKSTQIISDEGCTSAVCRIHVLEADPTMAMVQYCDGSLKKWDFTNKLHDTVQGKKKDGNIIVSEINNFVVTLQTPNITFKFWGLGTLHPLFTFQIKTENDKREKLNSISSIVLSPDESLMSFGSNLDMLILLKITK
ncbi:hypothetical protein AKO1_014887 [Acrasis kona]|uniref:Uncharacterized protein n=1 Tax=Acrasis kona TaxID=1008807 RepID=A0AAW2Z1X7_9EUKA